METLSLAGLLVKAAGRRETSEGGHDAGESKRRLYADMLVRIRDMGSHSEREVVPQHQILKGFTTGESVGNMAMESTSFRFNSRGWKHSSAVRVCTALTEDRDSDPRRSHNL